LHARQLLAWERAGLITPSEDYSFEALSQLRKLRDLQATTRISAKSIRASVDAMQRVAGMRNPLMEASFVRRGSRLSFRYGGALMDPLTQQLAFDFDTSPARQLRVVGIGVRVFKETREELHAQHAPDRSVDFGLSDQSGSQGLGQFGVGLAIRQSRIYTCVQCPRRRVYQIRLHVVQPLQLLDSFIVTDDGPGKSHLSPQDVVQ